MSRAAIGRRPATADLHYYPGDPIHVEATVVDGDGAAVDITGWTFEATIGEEEITTVHTDPAAGRFDLIKDDTAHLEGLYVWRLARVAPGDEATWIHGSARGERTGGSPTSKAEIAVVDGPDELVLQVLEGRPGTGMLLDGWTASVDTDGTFVTEEIS